MMIRFRFLLDSLYAAALLGPPLPGPYLLTQRPCLDLRCQALTYVLTYVAAMLVADIQSPDACGRFAKKLNKVRVNPVMFFCFCVEIFCFRDALILN